MRKCDIRCCLVLGGSLYTVYCSQLFFPSLALQYSCSVLLGAGAAILWTAQVDKRRGHQPSLQKSKSEVYTILTKPQGHMLAASSNCDTVSRNCGVFWSIFQIAPSLAALLVWALWGGEEESGTVKYHKCWRFEFNFFFLLLTRSWELFCCMHKPLSSCLVSWPLPCLVSPSPAAPPFCSSPSPTTE